MLFTSVDHVHVPSLDIEKSVEFYTKVLGFFVSRRLTMNGREFAYVGLGNTLLELHVPRDGKIPDGAGRPFGLAVSNLDDALAHLKEHGIEPIEVRPAWTFYGRHASITDPSGVLIELREWQDGDSTTYLDWQPRRDDIVRVG